MGMGEYVGRRRRHERFFSIVNSVIHLEISDVDFITCC